MIEIDLNTLKVGDKVFNEKEDMFQVTAIGQENILFVPADDNGWFGLERVLFINNFKHKFHKLPKTVKAWFPVIRVEAGKPFIVSVKCQTKLEAESFVSIHPGWKTIGAAEATWIEEEPKDVQLAC